MGGGHTRALDTFAILTSGMVHKFSIRFSISPALAVIFWAAALTSFGQDSLAFPSVIREIQDYDAQVAGDSAKEMLELKSAARDIIYDLRYTTSQNFTGKPLYPAGTKFTFLRLPAARALAKVQADLAKRGYRLKVFDAYRPYSVTKQLWELVRDERYAANPLKGSGHNRGIAVDLTIVEFASGRELPMGTGFDNFSDTAHHSFSGLPAEVQRNRQLLKWAMERHGFRALETEWWHYYYADGIHYDLLDISFRELLNRRARY